MNDTTTPPLAAKLPDYFQEARRDREHQPKVRSSKGRWLVAVVIAAGIAGTIAFPEWKDLAQAAYLDRVSAPKQETTPGREQFAEETPQEVEGPKVADWVANQLALSQILTANFKDAHAALVTPPIQRSSGEPVRKVTIEKERKKSEPRRTDLCAGMLNCAEILAAKPQAATYISACRHVLVNHSRHEDDVKACNNVFAMLPGGSSFGSDASGQADVRLCGGLTECETRLRADPRIAQAITACRAGFSGRSRSAAAVCDQQVFAVIKARI